MLILISGDLGTGKTLLLTYFATEYPDIPVYSNFKINLPNVIPIDIYSIGSVSQGIILIDEAYEWLESRLSGSDVNLYLSRLIFNSRKRGLDIACSAQLGSSLDLRFRQMANLRFICMGMALNFSGYLYIVNERSIFHLSIQKAMQLYNLYSTFEEQEALRPTLYDVNKLNPKIDELTKTIIKKCGKKIKVTKGIVRDLFLTNKWDISLQELVYHRIKRIALLGGKV